MSNESITGLHGPVPPEHAVALFKTRALAKAACARDGIYKRCAMRGSGVNATLWIVAERDGVPFTWLALCVSHASMRGADFRDLAQRLATELVRQTTLFDPAPDPALLSECAAAGLDVKAP